jgi:transcriptional regulator with XRE-family HTH domain
MEVATLGDRVRSERERLGLTQHAFAEAVSLSRDAIAKYELNKQLPTVENLLRISQHCGKPMEYFMTGSYPERHVPELLRAATLLAQAAEEVTRLAGLDRGGPESPSDKVVPLKGREREAPHAEFQNKFTPSIAAGSGLEASESYEEIQKVAESAVRDYETQGSPDDAPDQDDVEEGHDVGSDST